MCIYIYIYIYIYIDIWQETADVEKRYIQMHFVEKKFWHFVINILVTAQYFRPNAQYILDSKKKLDHYNQFTTIQTQALIQTHSW